MPHTYWRAVFGARTLELRAQFNAALTVVYERTAITVRELAAIADVSERDIYALLRRLGCRPRRPKVRFPGRSRRSYFGPRRKLKPRKPLDNAGARRALKAFRVAVRLLREHAQMREERAVLRAAAAVQRASARIARRNRVAQARDVRHLAYTYDGLSVWRGELAERRAPEITPEAAAATRAELALRIESMVASRQAQQNATPTLTLPLSGGENVVAATAPQPERTLPELAAELGIDDAKARRINEIAEAYYRRAEEKGPRIRSWD